MANLQIYIMKISAERAAEILLEPRIGIRTAVDFDSKWQLGSNIRKSSNSDRNLDHQLSRHLDI